MRLPSPTSSPLSPTRPRPLQAGDSDPEWGRSGRGGQGGERGPDGDRREPRPSGNGGPPDLDELWRDFNRKLNGLFGRRGGGGGGGGGGGFRPPRRPGSLQPSPMLLRRLLWGVLLAFVLGWLGSGFFVVQQGQVAVVSRLGRATSIDQPGLSWHFPAPFGDASLVDVDTLRNQPVGDSTVDSVSGAPRSAMLTADSELVDLRLNVQWRVGNALQFVFGASDPDAAVAQATGEAARAVVGALTLQQVLQGDHAALLRDTQQRVQALLDRWHTGISVTDLTVRHAGVPESVRAAYDAVAKARVDAQQLSAQAQAYASDVLPRAQGTADALMQQAEGYKAGVVAQAQGDAARFDLIHAQYVKAPQVTRESMYLQTMQQVLSSVTKVLVSSHASNNLLYLPLDKLLQAAPRAGASAPAAAGSPLTAPPTVVPPLVAPSTGAAPAAPAASGSSRPASATAPAAASAASPVASAAGASRDSGDARDPRDSRDTLRQRQFR